VRHRNIIRLYDSFETDRKLMLVLELVTGGDLVDVLIHKSPYTERHAAQLFRDVVDAVHYLHSEVCFVAVWRDCGCCNVLAKMFGLYSLSLVRTQSIVHRDLKPDNLLLHVDDKGNAVVKLCDFGLSKFVRPDVPMMTVCGTPKYVAPEILEEKGYGLEVDEWALGIILYIMLCGFPPFNASDERELFSLIRKGSFTFPAATWNDISGSAKDLITELLRVDPRKRIRAGQVCDDVHVGVCSCEWDFV
jgi:doublecortin-like kinase 3